MGTDNFAYGTQRTFPLTGVGLLAGLRTPFGTIIPPGARVVYVRSTGYQDGDPIDLAGRTVPTLAAGLLECRSGLGDFVIVLPGHSESVTDATMLTNLVAATRIIGIGAGAMMPVFRWTAAAAQWLISVNDVVITGLRLRLEGFNGVTKAIAVTGNDVSIVGNDIETGSGASNKATIAVEVGTGAAGGTRFNFCTNRVRGTAAGASTNILLVSNAADGINICDNDMIAAATTTNGLINVQSAATSILIKRNTIENTVASSVAGINFANVAVDGSCEDNKITVKNATTITQGTTGITVGGTNNLVGFFNNFTTNSVNASGLLTPAVDT